jgi:hypothetical protein
MQDPTSSYLLVPEELPAKCKDSRCFFMVSNEWSFASNPPIILKDVVLRN